MSELISIVMPVKNGGRYLSQCLDSIINQTYENWELLVVNDNSIDQTVNIVGAYNDSRIKIYDSKGKGIVDALNTGIYHSKGKFIARMDADDVMVPKRLETQYNFLESNLDLFGCGSNALKIDCNDKVLGKFKMPNSTSRIVAASRFKCPLIHPTVMFREEGFLYSKTYEKIEDYELWLRLIDSGKKFQNINSNLLYYRVHETSISGELDIRRRHYLLRLVFVDRLKLSLDEAEMHIKLLTGTNLKRFKLSQYKYLFKLFDQVGMLAKIYVFLRWIRLLMN